MWKMKSFQIIFPFNNIEWNELLVDWLDWLKHEISKYI